MARDGESKKASKLAGPKLTIVFEHAEDCTAIGDVFGSDVPQLAQVLCRIMPSEVKRLRQLEEENGKRKRTDKAMLQDNWQKALRPGARVMSNVW